MPESDTDKFYIEKTYYPIAIFNICLARDPRSKILMIFLPTMILGVLNIMCTQVHSIEDRMAILSFSFLGYLEIFRQLRAELPPIRYLTTAEKFVVWFLFIGLLPIIKETGEDKDFFFENFEVNYFAITLAAMMLPIFVLLWKIQ